MKQVFLWNSLAFTMIQWMLAIWCLVPLPWASLVAQRLKPLPGTRETWVLSLGREDPLEKGMATHSSTLAWRIPWREEPSRLQSMGSKRVGQDWGTSLSLSSTLSKPSLYIWKSSVYVLLKPSLKDFQHNLAIMWNGWNCTVIWPFFLALPFFGLEWKLIFSSPVATAEFSKFPDRLSAAVSQHHLLGFETAQLEFHHFH